MKFMLERGMLAAGIVLSCMMAAHASEGWQATAWGTPFERVRETYPTAEVNPDIKIACIGNLKARLSIPYDTGDYHFKVVMCFTADDTLSMVRLFLMNSAYGLSVLNDLEGKYGLLPRIVGGDTISPKTWMDGSTRIEFFDNNMAFGYAPGGPGRSVFVSYSRAVSASGKGL